ncbi:MAG: hypothetical protein R3301_10025 [Saprospiraceae bacterium]|nr:hypothetical protein [Saprospiraceae bacterium]
MLLFGEYTVLFGGRALAIPAPRWSGRLVQDKSNDPDQRLASWLEDMTERRVWPEADLARFRKDVEAGLRFESTIPEGYGLGSSGALCAAAFGRYRSGVANGDVTAMRELLAAMESFFHGSSSGLDPLVSYLCKPVLRERDLYTSIDIPIREAGAPYIFLVDSGRQRSTTEYVQLFMSLALEREFRQTVLSTMRSAADHAIAFLREGHWDLFWDHVAALSQLQLNRMQAFIPDVMADIWRSLDPQEVCLKLCGAGGGGMFLGFARTPDAIDRARQIPGYAEISEPV